VGLAGLTASEAVLDCGNSGTTMRLLVGVLAAQPFASVLVGDASLSRRPMGRVAEPLRARGARIEGTPHPSRPGAITAPLRVGPLPAGTRLSQLEYQLPVASAQVKSTVLLSGLYADGPTVVIEPWLSRDHTERMLRGLGIAVRRNGLTVHLEPATRPDALRPFDVDLPGDVSAAAFPLVAAQLVPGSEVCVLGSGLNPTRTGILDVIQAFGGAVTADVQGETLGEPFGAIVARSAALRAGRVAGELSVRAIDEIPVAAVLAARADGTSRFDDVAELRVKESDRIARTVELLTAFGVSAREREDGFDVVGQPRGRLRAARVSSHGDHRIAMSAAILGLLAAGETVIEDADCIATSFPGFVATLRALGAQVEVA
jgi:3-phosphoshikimate 1-carboxyvinyltransferase